MPKNIFLREGGYWFSRTKDRRRVWVNLQTKDLSDAIRRANEVRDNPLVVGQGFAADVDRFVESKVASGRFSRASAYSKKNILLLFGKSLPPSADASSVTAGQIRAWYEGCRSRMTEATASSYLMAVRSFCRWAVETRRRLVNPALEIKPAKSGMQARIRWVDAATKTRLIAEAPTDELRFILFCGFEAGLRRGEIVEARRDWFDLKTGSLHVLRADRPPRLRPGELSFAPKDRDERTIPLTAGFKAFLGGFLSDDDPLGFALWPDVKHGRWRYRYDFRKPFTDYMRAQKMDWVTPHVMRHSFASILASAGVSIFKVAVWLGDDVRVVQKHYAHLAAEDSDIQALAGALASSASPSLRRPQQATTSARSKSRKR